MNKNLTPHKNSPVASGSLSYIAKALESVGWFIPPYIQKGWLSSLVRKIDSSAGAFCQNELEASLQDLYSASNLAAMVLHRYRVAPIIKDYSVMISEAVEAHFLGLDHVAVSGLIPVIEGAGRQLAKSRGINEKSVTKAFLGLAEDCKREAIEKNIGAVDEIESMMVSFATFAEKYLYEDHKFYPLQDNTNRHGISHGSFSDQDYGRPLNFYKTIASVDFLTFISSFRADISCFAPEISEESLELARYYLMLHVLKEKSGLCKS